jgi:urease beta subunit
MPARPALPSAATLKHLHDGLAHHHKADYARSLVEFEAALALSPDDALARFDVACASARLGHFGRAEQELDTLLRLDLPAFLPRFEADPDLAALRGGPEGARLRARALVIADAYQRAAATGVSAVVFRPRPPEVDHALSDPRWLRAGVWIHEARRFVALAPEVPATAAWFDRAHRRTVVAHLDIVDCASDFCPALGGAEVSVFALGRAEPVATTHRDPDEDRLYQLSVRAGDAVWAELDTWSAHPDIRRFDGGDGSGAFAASAAPPVDAVRATLDVSPWGSLLTTQPEGLRVERGTLVRASGAPISLGPLHKRGAHAVVAHGERAVVVSSEVGCECNEREDSVYRHAVSIIDLAAGTATRFESGDGVAAVAIDDGGAVYLQVGEAVRRFPSIDAMPAGPGEPLAEGVLLTVPRHANSNCCGL